MEPNQLTPDELAAIKRLQDAMRKKPSKIAVTREWHDKSFDWIDRLLATVEALRAALSEIEKGRGPRSADPLTHADNIIANLQRIAREALAGTWRPTDAD